MKQIDIKATTGKKGSPEYKELPGKADQYESVKELQKAVSDDKKAEVILSLVNRQMATDALNKLRKPGEVGFGKLIAKVGAKDKAAADQIAEILKKRGIAI